MSRVPVSFGLLLLLHVLSSAGLKEAKEVDMEVVVSRTPCSATCGVGLTTETLCFLTGGEKVLHDAAGGQSEPKVSDKCRIRKVKCLQTWQCGLRTFTVTAGDRVELKCLEEASEDKGRFSWRVIWHFAKGVISSEDALFARLKAPLIDRVVLDPVRENDAGTYRCILQDTAFRRVKRIDWGIRVLPVGFVDLQYGSSQDDWDQQNQTVSSTQQHKERTALKVVVISFVIAGTTAGLVLLLLFRMSRRLLKRTR
ncbi:transmembrane protein 81-like [Thalassophryne amazonica]|uniref:transmembrane protein 81-like n=1 Tax=Thalassophryne amazonica TaxID=390379 RepID=UPI001472448E|nr:transmembrane protein 81-like [Thalassophryne amazonica]